MKDFSESIAIIFIIYFLLELFFNPILQKEPPTFDCYYIENPEIDDMVPNATQELFVKGELRLGRCLREGVQ